MSPEGRFTRRQHLAFQEEEDNDEGALELPEHYFADPAWDETLDVLRAMPWEHVPILHANVDVTVVEEHVTDRLSGLVASQAKVNARLMKRASKRTYLLMKGNHLVHEMDHNLSMAEMYVERSKESILHARGSEVDFTGLSGATVLLQDFDRRDQYKRLQCILDKVARLLEREQERNESLNKTPSGYGHGKELSEETLREKISVFAMYVLNYRLLLLFAEKSRQLCPVSNGPGRKGGLPTAERLIMQLFLSSKPTYGQERVHRHPSCDRRGRQAFVRRRPLCDHCHKSISHYFAAYALSTPNVRQHPTNRSKFLEFSRHPFHRLKAQCQPGSNTSDPPSIREALERCSLRSPNRKPSRQRESIWLQSGIPKCWLGPSDCAWTKRRQQKRPCSRCR